MGRLLWVLALWALAVFGWYLVADRATPFTGNARIKAVVTPIVPQVSGPVISLWAENGRLMQAGDELLQIDPRPYEIALSRAQAQLESATQAAGASSAEVAQAQGQLARAEAALANIKVQSARAMELERKGLIPMAQADKARATLAEATAAVDSARAAREAAEARLGGSGAENAGVQTALAAVAEAELDLTRTLLRAPARGAVSNLTLAEGAYASEGQALMSYVDAENVWVEAYLTENNLGNVAVGQPVGVALDMHPGRVFEGRVDSFSGAVALGSEGSIGLAAPPPSRGWMRAPQRFPVRIVIPGYTSGEMEDGVVFQVNGQADVVVYTGANPVANALGRAYLRVLSVLSFAY